MKKELDEYGRSSLHYAANDGNEDEVQRLINLGCDINLSDRGGWTPLHFAAQAYSPAVTAILISAGAHLDSRDSYGNTPLWRAVYASKGRGDVVVMLLTAGANPRLENKSGMTPYSLAQTIANYDVEQYFAGAADDS